MEDATVHEARLLLGRYRVERVLGGGMGVVYVAQDTNFDRKVAVKTIRPALAPDATQARELLLRFEREKLAHERVGNHPNLVTVYDFAIYRDPEPAPYLVLEYVAGGALSDRLQQGPIPLDIALRYTADIARGLGVAHAKQIVHRDIKPGNIFLATDGRAQVGDFGIAQVGDLSGRDDDATRRHPGTPLYMSPEQETKPGYLRPTSDQYSVGLVLFEMLTGEMYKQLSLRQLEERLAAMPPAVAALIRKMTAADPEARYDSMAQVHREIVTIYRSLQLALPEDDYATQMIFQASPQQWETPPSGSGERVATPPGAPPGRQTPRPPNPTAVDAMQAQGMGQPRSTPLVNLQPAAPVAPPTRVDTPASANAEATQVDERGVQAAPPAVGGANASTDSLAEMQRQITALREQIAADEQRRRDEEAAEKRRKQAEEEAERRQEADRVARQLQEVAEQQRRTEAAEREKRQQEAEAAARGPIHYPTRPGTAQPVYPNVSTAPPTYPPVYPPVYPAIPPKKKGSFGRRAFLLLLLGGGGGAAGYFAYRKGTEIAATKTPSPTTRPATLPPTTTFLTPLGVTAPPLGIKATQTPASTSQTPTNTSRPATTTTTRPPTTPTTAGAMLYQANFANWYSGKGTTDKSDFGYEAATREYHIANRNVNNMVYIFNPDKQTYGDCVIDADVRCHSGGQDAGFGVLVRGGTVQGSSFPVYNAFLISPLGFWAIWASDGGGTLKSVSSDTWNQSSSIKTGDVVNRLTVICKGTQLSLMINGTFVGGPFGAVRGDGGFGLGVISGAETPTISADGYFATLRVSSVS